MSSSTTPPTRPIPIVTHSRARSASVSSTDSNPGLSPSASSLSNSSFPTPILPSNKPLPSSPILSYFFGAKESPVKPLPIPSKQVSNPTTLPPLPDDESDATPPAFGPKLGHHRTLSVGSAAWNRFPSSTTSSGLATPQPSTEASQRGAGVLRRLSLSSGFSRPYVGAPTMDQQGAQDNNIRRTASVTADRPHERPTRRATVGAAEGARYRPRAPSPMGERMLKGHFDGFN